MVKILGIYGKDPKIMPMFKALGFGKLEVQKYKKFASGHVTIPTWDKNRILKSRDVIATFSGIIYDYDNELQHLKMKGYGFKKDDATEFIMNSYLEYGMSFVARLNGRFVLSVYDIKKDTVYIANDRFGVTPVYYYSSRSGFVFASEIKSIIAAKSGNKDIVQREINWEFWKDLFAYGFPLGTKTPFKGIDSLPNATILTYTKGLVHLEKYWDYDMIKVNNSRSEHETIIQGVALLKSVFTRQAAGIKECNVLLSGGYDSRCIASSLRKFTDIKEHAYTIAKSYLVPTDEFGDRDARYAHMISDKLGIQYTLVGNQPKIYETYFIKQIELMDGMCTETLWTMPLQHELDANYVTFDGLIGDIFTRAGWLSKISIAKPDRPIDEFAMNVHKQMMEESELDPTIYELFIPDIGKKLRPDSYEVKKELEQIPIVPYRVKIFHSKNMTKNITSLIANNIMMRKSFSIMPFCDNDYAMFALSIPPKMKVNKNIYQKILIKSFPDIMKIPTTNDPKNFKENLGNNLSVIGLAPVMHAVLSLKKNLKSAFKKEQESKIIRSYARNPRDVTYLIRLAKELKLPVQIDKVALLKRIDDHVQQDIDPTYFLEPMMHFVVWYNKIYLKKSA